MDLCMSRCRSIKPLDLKVATIGIICCRIPRCACRSRLTSRRSKPVARLLSVEARSTLAPAEDPNPSGPLSLAPQNPSRTGGRTSATLPLELKNRWLAPS